MTRAQLINIYKKDDALVVPLRIIREDASGENYLYVMNEDVKEGVNRFVEFVEEQATKI